MSEESCVGLVAGGDGDSPVLRSVAMDGRLDGALLSMTLRQAYRNDGARPLEVVYTFPLPVGAVLMGFATELDGVRQEGRVVARHQAERQYEEALAGGDAPAMLEQSAQGLLTANVGNLKPGESMVVELRYAQALLFEQGRLRIAVPTTVAPRYGDAAAAGLQPQQVPVASLAAEHPLSMSLVLGPEFAGADVSCATHRVERRAEGGGVRLDLAPGAALDRDVVVLVTPREPHPSLLVLGSDAVRADAPMVAMAALQVAPAVERARVALKLLVDCSGSMAGSSIASARSALRGIAGTLRDADHASLSLFGTTVEHRLGPTSMDLRGRAELLDCVEAVDANLGGTEMEAGLREVFSLRVPAGAARADVLLITDGEVWQAEAIVQAARRSGHRVFAIGVGSAPAEGVLRQLAEATGGACEFATPGESLEAAARRMAARIRQQPWSGARVSWGAEPAWQTEVPGNVFGGDTVLAFAGLRAGSAVSARLVACGEDGAEVEVARATADVPVPGSTIARMGAARRVASLAAPEAASMSLAYELLGEHTHCVLVHERADADKVTEAAELHRVTGMLAAGWGGVGDVHLCMHESRDAMCSPAISHSPITMAKAALPQYDFSQAMDVRFCRAQSEVRVEAEPPSLAELAELVWRHLQDGGDVDGLAEACMDVALHEDVEKAFWELVATGMTRSHAWLLFAHWMAQRLRHGPMESALGARVDALGLEALRTGARWFDHFLGHHAMTRWTSPRSERLDRAMGRVA